jgi:hypothetical protein
LTIDDADETIRSVSGCTDLLFIDSTEHREPTLSSGTGTSTSTCTDPGSPRTTVSRGINTTPDSGTVVVVVVVPTGGLIGGLIGGLMGGLMGGLIGGRPWA